MNNIYTKKLPNELQQQYDIFWSNYKSKVEETDIQQINNNNTVAESLPLVTSCSAFISRLCLRYPQMLLDFATDSHPKRLPDKILLRQELILKIVNSDNDDQLLSNLRQFRQKYMMRIAWYDFADWSSVEQSLQDLSELADVIVDEVNHYWYKKLSQRFGEPCNKTGSAMPLLIVAMGKLGGHELNFSSDIDLIFVYPEAGQTNGKQRVLDNQDFFSRLGQKIITSLNNITAEGFVYRVDMRLRPFGDSGALVLNFDALEHYYQGHAREWERYAWIKGRVISGTKILAEQLYQLLRPFIYRRYLDFSAFEALRDLKIQIDQAVKKKFTGNNIKLGKGGIREIEFIVQAYQLIRGGRQPSLQQRSLLKVLEQLKQQKNLDATIVDELRAAYIFLRHLENHLQAIDDQQTQLLPTDSLNQQRLAHSLQYPDWQACMQAWQQHQSHVANHFQALIFIQDQQPETAEMTQLKRLWINCGTDKIDQLSDSFNELGYQEPEQLAKTLQIFEKSPLLKRQSSQGRQRLDKLMPLLLDGLANYSNQAILLQRLLDLLGNIAQRSVYLALLTEQAPLLTHVLQLYANSTWLVTEINRYPLLLDELLSDRLQNQAQIQQSLKQRLEQIPADDLELQMDILRHFKRAQTVQIAADELTGQIKAADVSDSLSLLADTLLEQTLKLAWQHLQQRYGKPCYQDSETGETKTTGFCIIAYGKAGSKEMSYESDLDIIFLHDSNGTRNYTDGDKSIDNTVFFTRLINRLTHLLSTRTAAGRLYETDFRLRPEGNSGLLVCSLKAFNDYQQHKAWIWEHQALIRARAITGDLYCQQQFNGIRAEILSQSRDNSQLKQDIKDMRQKMHKQLDKSNSDKFYIKQGKGGLTDIEFLVQYWVLNHAHSYKKLSQNTGVYQLLQQLAYYQLIPQIWADQLSDIYYSYRSTIDKLSLQQQNAVIADSEYQQQRDYVQTRWQQVFDTL